jgi:hypothetical protein
MQNGTREVRPFHSKSKCRPLASYTFLGMSRGARNRTSGFQATRARIVRHLPSRVQWLDQHPADREGDKLAHKVGTRFVTMFSRRHFTIPGDMLLAVDGLALTSADLVNDDYVFGTLELGFLPGPSIVDVRSMEILPLEDTGHQHGPGHAQMELVRGNDPTSTCKWQPLIQVSAVPSQTAMHSLPPMPSGDKPEISAPTAPPERSPTLIFRPPPISTTLKMTIAN